MTQVNEKKEPTPRETSVPNQYSNKLLEFQKKVSAISKDSVNPFFKSKYFDVNTVIDTIKPILNEVGLTASQPLEIVGGKNALVTRIHDGEKELLTSAVYIPEIADIQKFGAALTYLRRYALVSLLLLQGEEDDDGNTASKPKSAPQATKPTPAVASANKGLPMTDKQNKMIHALMQEKGVMHLSDIGIEKIEKPTMEDASKIIKTLMDYKIQDIQVDGDYPQ